MYNVTGPIALCTVSCFDLVTRFPVGVSPFFNDPSDLSSSRVSEFQTSIFVFFVCKDTRPLYSVKFSLV